MNTRTLWRRWWMMAGAIASIPLAVGIFAWADSTVGEPYDPRAAQWLSARMRERLGPSNLEDLVALAPGVGTSRADTSVFSDTTLRGMHAVVEASNLADTPAARGILAAYRDEARAMFAAWDAEAARGVAWFDPLSGHNAFTAMFNYNLLRNAGRARAAIALSDAAAGQAGAESELAAAARMGDPLRPCLMIGPMITLMHRSDAFDSIAALLDHDLSADDARGYAAVVRDLAADPVVLSGDALLSEGIMAQEMTRGIQPDRVPNPIEAAFSRKMAAYHTALNIDSYASATIVDVEAWDDLRRLAKIEGGAGDFMGVYGDILPWTRPVLVSSRLRRLARTEPALMATAPIPAEAFGDAPADERIFNSFPFSWLQLATENAARFRARATHEKLQQAAWAMRVHRLERGAWPASLDELDPALWTPLPAESLQPTDIKAPLVDAMRNQSPFGPVVVGTVRTDSEQFIRHVRSELGEYWGLQQNATSAMVAPRVAGNVRWRWSDRAAINQVRDVGRAALLAEALALRTGPERSAVALETARANEEPRPVSPADVLAGNYGDVVSWTFEIEFPPTVPAVWVACDSYGNPRGDGSPYPTSKLVDDTFAPDFVAFPAGMLRADAGK